MLRNNGRNIAPAFKVNGDAPEKVAFSTQFEKVNGYASEKFQIQCQYVHFSSIFMEKTGITRVF